MRKRVVITGLGCVSPLGNDASTLWSNLLAGKSGVGFITHYDTSQFKVKIGAEVKDFDGVSHRLNASTGARMAAYHEE